MQAFLDALAVQRHDDHRYYHHSRINQALHLFSALCFLVSYALVFTNPAAAALVGWLLAMTSRQVGHFFFEPKDYDAVNDASHEHKEAIKVGYNLRRKVVLMSIWAMSPAVLWFEPTLFGLLDRPAGLEDWLDNVGLVWLSLGGAALIFRAAQLTIRQDLRTAVVWLTKIVTDPIHDVVLYYKAPLHLLRGEMLERRAARDEA